MPQALIKCKALTTKKTIEKELVLYRLDLRVSGLMSRFLVSVNKAYRTSSHFTREQREIRDMIIAIDYCENILRKFHTHNSYQYYIEEMLGELKHFFGAPLTKRFLRVETKQYPYLHWFCESSADFRNRIYTRSYSLKSGERGSNKKIRRVIDEGYDLTFDIYYLRESAISYLIQKGFRPDYTAFLRELNSFTTNPNAVDPETFFSSWAMQLLEESKSPNFLISTEKGEKYVT